MWPVSKLELSLAKQPITFLAPCLRYGCGFCYTTGVGIYGTEKLHITFFSGYLHVVPDLLDGGITFRVSPSVWSRFSWSARQQIVVPSFYISVSG